MKEFCDFSCDMAKFCSDMKTEAGETIMQFIEATGQYSDETAAELAREDKTAEEIETALRGIRQVSAKLREPIDGIRLPARTFLVVAEDYCHGPDPLYSCGMAASREFQAANEMRQQLGLDPVDIKQRNEEWINWNRYEQE